MAVGLDKGIVALNNNEVDPILLPSLSYQPIQVVPPTTNYLPKFSPSPVTISILDPNSSPSPSRSSISPASSFSFLSPSPSPSPNQSTPAKRRKGAPSADPTKAGLPGYSKHGVKLGRKTMEYEETKKASNAEVEKKVKHSDQVKSLATLLEGGLITQDEFIT